MKYCMLLLLCMVSGFTIFLPRIVINTSAHRLYCHSIVLMRLGAIALWIFLPNPTCEFCVDSLPFGMAPVVRIEPNGIQTLLSYDNARDDLERNGWRVFIEKFKGFNLRVSQEFALWLQSKDRSVQLEVTEDFLKLTP
jgi:hypothetical protein